MQIIHTDVGILGTTAESGCANFYLNSGIIQPGLMNAIPALSHYYACVIFAWTLDPHNKCYSNDGNELLGVHSHKHCGVYHFKSNAQPPYCNATLFGQFLG